MTNNIGRIGKQVAGLLKEAKVKNESAMREKLDLRVVEWVLREPCRKHAEEGDIVGMFCCMGGGRAMPFFIDNARWFRERGRMEEALLCAWNIQKFAHGYQQWMRVYLATSDRKKLGYKTGFRGSFARQRTAVIRDAKESN